MSVMCVFYFTRKQDNFLQTKFKIIGGVLDLTLGKAFSVNLIAFFATNGRVFFFQEWVIFFWV